MNTHISTNTANTSPEWIKYCNNKYYKHNPNKKTKSQINELTSLGNALAHMKPSDRHNFDTRTYFVTIHLTKSVHHIKKKITAAQRKINRLLISHFRYGSLERTDKIGIINSIDYSGSRNAEIDHTSNPTPHLHLTIIFPKTLYSYLNPETIPQEIAAALLECSFVQPYEVGVNGDIISKGIEVQKYSPFNPLWYVVDYNSKLQRHEGFYERTVISPKDEIFSKFKTEKKRRNFLLMVDGVIDGLINSPERYFFYEASKDWCADSSSYSENGPIEVVIPASMDIQWSAIERIVDDYISSCMNCYVRALDFPLATKRIEILLASEFKKYGGRWQWLQQQDRAQHWLDYWRKIWRVDVAA